METSADIDTKYVPHHAVLQNDVNRFFGRIGLSDLTANVLYQFVRINHEHA